MTRYDELARLGVISTRRIVETLIDPPARPWWARWWRW